MMQVILRCKSDAAHFSVMLNLSSVQGMESLRELLDSDCLFCGSSLIISESASHQSSNADFNFKPLNTSHSYTSLKKEVKTASAIVGTKNIIFESPTPYLTGFASKGTVSSHISQLLPVRAGLDVLASMLYQQGKISLPLNQLKEPIEVLQNLRYALVNSEVENNLTQRGSRPSAGFPKHQEENSSSTLRIADKSWNRYFTTVYGGISKKNEKPFGALFELGLASLGFNEEKKIQIGLTKWGFRLASIENPLIHRPDMSSLCLDELKQRFSQEEISLIWECVISNEGSTEREAIVEVMNLLCEISPLHVEDITEMLTSKVKHVTDMKRDGNPPQNRAYVSSLLARWMGLGLLRRTGPGTYQISSLGKEMYNQWNEAQEAKFRIGKKTWKKK